jgi:HTH-type transcriptional regulator/antitoxin HigA
MTTSDYMDFDDFPLSPTGSQSAADYFESFLKSKEMFASIPKKEKRDETDATFLSFVNEVHIGRVQNPALYRRTLDARESLSALWLSKIRNFASVFRAVIDVPDFVGLSEQELIAIGKLSVDVRNVSLLSDYLLRHGIILIYERAIPGMKLDGAVFLLDSGNPVVALTLRHPRLDNFWFTLMHELSHIVLHYDLLTNPILDDLDESPIATIEKQADKLAAGSLISRSDWRSCPAKYDLTKANTYAFAAAIGVHPSIVAGRLRKEMKRYDIFSDIVNEVNTRALLLDDE